MHLLNSSPGQKPVHCSVSGLIAILQGKDFEGIIEIKNINKTLLFFIHYIEKIFYKTIHSIP